jgi:hypothetical protein
VAPRKALDAAVRFVNEFDEFASFLAAAIAHESSIGEQRENTLTRTVNPWQNVPEPNN